MNRSRFRGLLIVALVVLVLGACAKPPTAEIEAATAAVAKAEADADAVQYAAPSVARAKDALSRMQAAVAAKQYDSAKTLAQETIQAADKVIADGASAKARARDEATSLLLTVKTALAETADSLAAAARVRGISLDVAGTDREIQAAASVVDAMGADVSAGNYNAAISKGQSVRSTLGTIQQRITSAVQAVSRKK
jgi:flagellin-like hook-associated protein FlgL